MTTIFERVTTALSSISPAVPFALAPYKSTGTLPSLYIVYQLIDDSPVQAADDDETERAYVIQVSIFNTAGLVSLPDVIGAMKTAGFHVGSRRQIPQDQGTGHYGLAIDFSYL